MKTFARVSAVAEKGVAEVGVAKAKRVGDVAAATRAGKELHALFVQRNTASGQATSNAAVATTCWAVGSGGWGKDGACIL